MEKRFTEEQIVANLKEREAVFSEPAYGLAGADAAELLD